MVEFTVTLAKVEDTDLLVRHRIGMWKDIRPELVNEADKLRDVTGDWIKRKLTEGKLVGFIVKTPSEAVAGSGCIWLREDAPRPGSNRLESPYLMSIYTEESFRRQGVASLIVQKAIDWCREHNYVRISLHASDVGAKVYEVFGFKATNEMRLML